MLKITREEFHSFIKTKNETSSFNKKATQHYLKYFDQYQKTGQKVNWNWAAFLGKEFWLIYRKAYLYGLPLLIIDMLLYASIVLDYLPRFNLLRILYRVILACYGDYIYLQYAAHQISKGKTTGGVNAWLPCVVLLIMASFFGILGIDKVLALFNK